MQESIRDGFETASLWTATDSTLSTRPQLPSTVGKAVVGVLWSLGKLEWLGASSSAHNPSTVVFKMLVVRQVNCASCSSSPIRVSAAHSKTRSYNDVIDGVLGNNTLFYCDRCRTGYIDALRGNSSEFRQGCERLVQMIRRGDDGVKLQAIDLVTALVSLHWDFAVSLTIHGIKIALEEILIECSHFISKDPDNNPLFECCHRALVSVEEAAAVDHTRMHEYYTAFIASDSDSGAPYISQLIKDMRNDAYRALAVPNLIDILKSCHADQDLLRTINPGIFPAFEKCIEPSFVELLWQLLGSSDPIDYNSACSILPLLYEAGQSDNHSLEWQWKSLLVPIIKANVVASRRSSPSGPFGRVTDKCLTDVTRYLREREDRWTNCIAKFITVETRRLIHAKASTNQQTAAQQEFSRNIRALVDLVDISGLKVYRRVTLLVMDAVRSSVANPAAANPALEPLHGILHGMSTGDVVSNLMKSRELRIKLISLYCDGLGSTADRCLRDSLQADERDLLDLIEGVLDSETNLIDSLLSQEEDAAAFLDLLQWAIDSCHMSGLRSQHRDITTFLRRLSRTLMRLSQGCQRLPRSLTLEDVRLRSADAVAGGGFADVFMATHDGKDVALKRLRVFQGRAEERISVRKKFCKEALIWQQLRHPFVLPFLGIDGTTFAPLMCMVSPWMSNGGVLQHIERHAPLGVNVDILLLEIAEGLTYLHESGLVHGDLRGANILVNEGWHVQLSDFGLTGIIDGTQRSSSRCGSVRWMAPELINPRAFQCKVFQRTTASDVYAFSCVCLELYTLRMPFSSDMHDSEVILAVIDGIRPDKPSPEDCNGRVLSHELWQLITRCWVQQPDQRLTSREIISLMHRVVKS